MERTIPARSEVPVEHTWDIESVFATLDAWEAEYAWVESRLPALAQGRGRVAGSATELAAWLEAVEAVAARLNRVGLYASLSQSVDASDEAAQARFERARGLIARFSAATSFAEPEMIAAGPDRLRAWIAEEPRLADYGQYFDGLRRRAPHVRSAEVEEVLSRSQDPLSAAAAVHGVLANAELRFEPARDSEGTTYEVAQGTINGLLASGDRELRRTAWESYADAHLAYRKTMAASISAGVRRDAFVARVRGYDSSLEGALGPNHIPTEVFHNTIATFLANLGTWHRYWRVRRRLMGLDRLHAYDTRASLALARREVPYEQAVDWIADGVSPLGEEYVRILREGATANRWVDIYPNRGKRMGAYSACVPGTHPFIFMSYGNDLAGMSTLAHELGHSMHSHYTTTSQPFVYGRYGIFVAEVASNFHQALVRARLLAADPDPDFEVAVIEEAMGNFHRYFFVMPSLARFELEVHSRVERGDALSADDLTGLMAGLMQEVYGDEVEADRDRTGITWAQFHTHLYSNFYCYQYATGIAGAHALAERVLSGDQSAAARYLDFLKAGSSVYPLDALRMAGVDLASPEPVEKAFAVVAGYVDRLERLAQRSS